MRYIHNCKCSKRWMITLSFILCHLSFSLAQITIGGNVYGGGNAGDTGGSTSVTVHAGEIEAVYGGARMANVGGSAFVNIDGEHASADILIANVYGGNDISGTIGQSTEIPTELENVKTETTSTDLTKNDIDNSWNAFIHTSPCKTKQTATIEGVGEVSADKMMVVVGTLYGGGNGDYTYKGADEEDLIDNDGNYIVRDGEGNTVATSKTAFNKPELAKTYLELKGGCIAHVYGGGNNATVTENTTIHIDNTSDDLETAVKVWAVANNKPLDEVFGYLIDKVKLPIFQSNLTSFAYNFSRVFGGNNKAPMAIRPKWNLQQGIIRDLYSGGNQGAMTSPNGILLSIKPTTTNADKLKIGNVFGGCRIADVNPAKNAIAAETIDGTYYPAGYSARVLIEGGDITNVYGGNDISGNIYGGNAVGIHSSIKGDVYGGGNGSYAYTDNPELGEMEDYKDFYYDVNKILGKAEDYVFNGFESVQALNRFRPNAESVSIRLIGEVNKPTIIGGGVYCGGNSATLHNETAGANAASELKIGSYVIADKVFLGNNGANMVTGNILEQYAKSITAAGVIVENGGYDFSRMTLADDDWKIEGRTQFDMYMDGVTMQIMPRVVFDDVGTYVPYSTYFGSFYCGGNVGSMKIDGAINVSFNDKVVIYDKVVGGSNEANVYQTDYNTQYLGGILGSSGANGNKLILNFDGLKIQPMRWKEQIDNSPNVVYPNQYLEWNTVKYDTETKTYTKVDPVTSGSGTSNADDLVRRLKGGNIYGGCYSNGHVEGNVIINLNATIHERDKLFDVVANEGETLYENVENAENQDNYYTISKRNTGVILSHQGMDVLGAALNVFGGGYGGDSEIWGSATINLNGGYTFQIFGGGEMGAIGKAEPTSTSTLTYVYNPDYSTYINLNGDATLPGVARGAEGDSPDMAECEFIYGGAFEGMIAGDTHVNLGNGRIFNSFAGSCNADILGHTETYVGRQKKSDGTYEDGGGFPWVRDHLYGGNDLGGSIKGYADFTSRIRNEVKDMVNDAYKAQVARAIAYMEYTQGRVRNIHGGCFGDYDYTLPEYSVKEGDDDNDYEVANKPYLHNSFVNFRPNGNASNFVEKVFGAGEGYPGDRDGDKGQDHSYVLIDIPNGVENFANTEVFGAGAYNGLGMRYTAAETFGNNFDINEASAIIDLMRGQVGAAYGGSYEQGITRRTMVNVPIGSTIKIGSIFGGAYGAAIYEPCDVYEANVNYNSEDAYLIYNPRREDEKTKQMIGNELQKGAIYGGNNAERRTLYGRININVPVKQKHYLYDWSNATIYGAGCGSHTWSEYTEVNLNPGARVWEVYGGGEAGGVFNAESAQAYITSNPDNVPDDQWLKAWTLGSGYDDGTFATGFATNKYADNSYTNLSNPLVREAEIDDRADIAPTDTNYKRYNTNVIIHKGAYVGNYAYGGGYGLEGDEYYGSGDVYGTTYIALLGGIVNKDIYAAGTSGAVYNLFGANFTASTNAYIAGGMLRNVYGGGWKGDVGRHTGILADPDHNIEADPNSLEGDILAETHVVIGIRPDQTDDKLVPELNKVLGKDNATKSDYGFYAGVPAIQRNAYGGGEGGAIYGSTYLTINNGYIGYVHLNENEKQNEQGEIVSATETTTERYEEKIDDDTYYVNNVWSGKARLRDCGNVFGGGYDVKSSVDFSHITMWNGMIRNSLVGGGEIATIGRGAIDASGPSNSIRTLRGIYKAGKTNIEMFNGRVLRNVFGGGKGYNLFGYGQQGTLYMDGYVFGQTEVHIHGGEIGTDEGLSEGYGNVFGGGDIGYVYSPSIYSTKTQQKTGTGSPGHIYYYDTAGNLTEDCKVVVSPYLQVKSGSVTYDGKTYNQYDYVPTDYLNTLPKKDGSGNWTGGWENLITGDSDAEEERGVYIHNAVFGGGNVSSNSDQTYANATTIYGNTTATLYDVFHRDFITVGTEHTGGIYGGGNLSVVDGYRELNITNYGTDYYGLKQTISIQEYRGLSNRERAYFQLEYKCTAVPGIQIGDVYYEEGKRLTEEDYLKLANNTDENIANLAKSSFEPYGFCSIYAGRLLNTIQRADLCGVFGSRMVLQGAKDRVAEVGEDIDYTINRIGELSLNQQRSVRTSANGYANPDTGDDFLHGNYFGIYSLVNYLGNMTSDVHFSDEYVNGNGETETDKTYFTYKANNYTSSDRNKGKSFNQVALASGVFLELTTENSTKEHKDYGYVTGVIELDLINVKKDQVGGGFVYAKNEHRVPRCYPDVKNVLLSSYNKQTDNEAVTYKRLRYSSDDVSQEWSSAEETAYNVGRDMVDQYSIVPYETSGNFIHHEKRIVDDCYPTNNAYIIGSANYSEAHYWYVKGEVYIYDQKVSAYTGSANAYSKEVHLPLTITAASHGQLQLLNVKPNLYAYKMPGATDSDAPVKIGSLNGSDGKPIDKVTVNNESDSYKLNDVISWWDWHQLSAADRQYFVTETYVNCVTCIIDGVEYEQGTYVMDQTDYDNFMAGTHDIRNSQGDHFTDDDNHDIGKTYVFRSSNNISHETGYLLTFDMNTPKVWDDYYSPTTGSSSTGKIMKSAYEAKFTDDMDEAQKQAIIDAWREGPTFTPMETGVYGKRSYKAGEVITEGTYLHAGEGQDKMKPAYVATESVTYTYNSVTKTVNPGTAISETEYNALEGTPAYGSFAKAFFCTNSVKLTNENYMLYGELKTADEIAAMKAIEGKLATDAEIEAALTPAYICTQDGEYGGQRFETGTNYSAIQAWSSLPATDRTKFDYNFDALDLLTNSTYLTVDPDIITSPSHESTVAAFHAPYTNQVDVEYQAVFKKNGVDVEFNGSNLADGAVLTNDQFETIRNDKRHYSHVTTTKVDEEVYIAKDNFVYLGTPYGRGQVVDADVYNANTSDVERVQIPTVGEWYYCYEDYQDKSGSTVNKGKLLTKAEYGTVPNDQQYFIIQGQEPTETTTLYVSRESNAYDVMKEKIITVVYQYTYYEDEDDGSVKLTNELHVINVHLDLESGVPQIGQLSPPATVLPGNAVGLRAPDVTPGLYEVLTSGWELYTTQDDADNHRNGVSFENNNTPVYWYQNGKNYIAFYSKTYLGKTYSNPVPLSVANYHDLDKVMQDKVHHLYVDKSNVDRPSKIYIDNRKCESDETKSELDLLKDFFDLSVNGLDGHASLDSHVRGGANLEFILNSDVAPKAYTTWVPIGNDSQCFEGNLHGDGHTISGLSNSLFDKLCGSVYNLGVTGSFTSAGVVNEGAGYVENCWINTTGEPDGSVRAVFGNPTRGDGTQIVNCYYPTTKTYSTNNNGRGLATPMSEKDFYNGTVAYNLNDFYLNKRYYDGIAQASGKEYHYYQEGTDGEMTDKTSYYPLSPAATIGDLGYVEDRYADGDFRYANGEIPETVETRMRTIETDENTITTTFAPIWPDDYLYFGQTLNYGWGDAPQDEPGHFTGANRVYRAPAYYGSQTKGVFHYNPDAYIVAYSTLNPTDATLKEAYPGMTAVDFAGYKKSGNNYVLDKDYTLGWNDQFFYQPLLDDDGLTSVTINGETQNLLVYAPSADANQATYDKLIAYFAETEPAFELYYDESNYHRVDKVSASSVVGHLVESGLIAKNDHLLVDKQEFNCPIEYSFEDGHRMWYQRKPDNYVDDKKGWETISLPFTAELVSTQQKGEITHFYEGSTTGHEYWLREYAGGSPDDNKVFVANFNKLEAGSEMKSDANTFLWDYYYSNQLRRDANTDLYQEYYKTTRTYNDYPYIEAGTPYIIGFPGSRYYEFDLSGEFEPEHTYAAIDKLDEQTITFVSEPNTTIGVSDVETAGVSKDGFVFRPNYKRETLKSVTTTEQLNQPRSYYLNAAGDAYVDDGEGDIIVLPFRPYFETATTSGGNAKKRNVVRRILFAQDETSFGFEENDPRQEEAGGELRFYVRGVVIGAESSLRNATDVLIVNTSGQTIGSFTINPGETIETPVPTTGVYILRAAGGKYNKKVTVK